MALLFRSRLILAESAPLNATRSYLSQSLALLNKIRLDARFNSFTPRDLVLKKFPGEPILKTKLDRAPMNAIGYGDQHYVDSLVLPFGG